MAIKIFLNIRKKRNKLVFKCLKTRCRIQKRQTQRENDEMGIIAEKGGIFI